MNFLNRLKAAGSARSYHLKNGCVGGAEGGSITSGSNDGLGESVSSGYWSKGEANHTENELDENLKNSAEISKIGRWHIPKQDFIVNRVEVKEDLTKTENDNNDKKM